MNSTPGVFTYIQGFEKTDSKYGKFCPRERDFSEFEVPRLKVAPSRVCILRSENSLGSKFCGALLIKVWMQKTFSES